MTTSGPASCLRRWRESDFNVSASRRRRGDGPDGGEMSETDLLILKSLAEAGSGVAAEWVCRRTENLPSLALLFTDSQWAALQKTKRTLGRLKRAGLVRTSRSMVGSYRRTTFYSLTDAGRAKLAELENAK